MARGPDASLRLTRRLAASPEEVFDAWCDAALLRQWFQPGNISLPVIELDLRVGGAYRIVMRDEDDDYDHHGEYVEVERPRRLAFTWISPATKGETTLVTIELEPDGDGTALTLTHARLPGDEAAARHRGGWSNVLESLAKHVASNGR